MRDHLFFEQLHKLYSEEFNSVHEEFESVSSLYKNIPLSEASKREFLEKSYKSKSAFYACLVNSNIDVLLVPEYLESKLSRNILIKKETDQYFKSIENFKLHTIQIPSAIYDCILYSDEVEQANSFDLFSNQVPESASCPEELRSIFDQWSNDFKDYSNLETLLFSILDWHAYNQFSFSNKRQIILYLNFQLWKQYGHVFQKLNIESYLFENWNTVSLDPAAAVKGLMHFIKNELAAIKLELKEAYRLDINFKRLNPKQRIVSNFIFDKSFKLNLRMDNGSVANNSLIKQIQKKGFVDFNELSQHSELLQQKKDISMLIDSAVLDLYKVDGEIGLYLNTSFNNKKKYLYQYQNIRLEENGLSIDDFLNQSISNPIVPIEKLIMEIPEPVMEVKTRRQKAFFG